MSGKLKPTSGLAEQETMPFAFKLRPSDPDEDGDSGVLMPRAKQAILFAVFVLLLTGGVGLLIALWTKADRGLLVLTAASGMLGGLLNAGMSFARHRGQESLEESWFAWYLMLPFAGVILGIIMHGLLASGMLPGVGSDAPRPTFVVLGALAGCFSKPFTHWLGAFFDRLLDVPRYVKEKAPGPSIESIKDEKAGDYRRLTIQGGPFLPSSKITVADQAYGVHKADPENLVILVPEKVSKDKPKVHVTVMNSRHSFSTLEHEFRP